MLDLTRANAKTATLNTAFAAIGVDGDTKMPRAKGNNEPIAWEYHVASHLSRIAEARKKKAQAAAVKAGVMFDPEKQPLAVGANALVFAGEVVEISVSVSTPTTKLELPELLDDLEKAGLKRPVINRLVVKHTKDNRAPHKFTSSLVTG
jgi:hypothetical protein